VESVFIPSPTCAPALFLVSTPSSATNHRNVIICTYNPDIDLNSWFPLPCLPQRGYMISAHNFGSFIRPKCCLRNSVLIDQLCPGFCYVQTGSSPMETLMPCWTGLLWLPSRKLYKSYRYWDVPSFTISTSACRCQDLHNDTIQDTGTEISAYVVFCGWKRLSHEIRCGFAVSRFYFKHRYGAHNRLLYRSTSSECVEAEPPKMVTSLNHLF
jgi:hypothetical protein